MNRFCTKKFNPEMDETTINKFNDRNARIYQIFYLSRFWIDFFFGWNLVDFLVLKIIRQICIKIFIWFNPSNIYRFFLSREYLFRAWLYTLENFTKKKCKIKSNWVWQVLAPGGAKDPIEILSDFLGREPSIQAFVDRRANSS